MKVVDLGNHAVAIEPDETADGIARLGVSPLQDHWVSSEAIQIYCRYVGATPSATSVGAAGAAPSATPTSNNGKSD